MDDLSRIFPRLLLCPALFLSGCFSQQEPSIVFTPEAVDESAGGVHCFKIETSAATYYLEKSGFGLSSMIDREGHDWISFEPTPGSRAAGEFRGFPNAVHKQAGNYFHPRNAATEPSVATVDYVGSERVTISAVSENQLWAGRFDFYPTHCVFTMTRMPTGYKYWVLYEGTPGGELEGTDWWMTPDKLERQPIDTVREGDLPEPEWMAFGDAALDRVLFVRHHQDDEYPDRHYAMGGVMTVFGFGRQGIDKFIDRVPRSFSIGFVESVDPEKIASAVMAAKAPN